MLNSIFTTTPQDIKVGDRLFVKEQWGEFMQYCTVIKISDRFIYLEQKLVIDKFEKGDFPLYANKSGENSCIYFVYPSEESRNEYGEYLKTIKNLKDRIELLLACNHSPKKLEKVLQVLAEES